MSFRIFGNLKVFILACALLGNTASFAQCPVLNVMVQGEVENPPRDGVVRVQLVYSRHSKDQYGESGEVTLDGSTFRVWIPFLTESAAPVLGLGNFKCNLKPKTVIVTLIVGEHEYDRVSLEWAKDFKMADPTAYIVRSELILRGTP